PLCCNRRRALLLHRQLRMSMYVFVELLQAVEHRADAVEDRPVPFMSHGSPFADAAEPGRRPSRSSELLETVGTESDRAPLAPCHKHHFAGVPPAQFSPGSTGRAIGCRTRARAGSRVSAATSRSNRSFRLLRWPSASGKVVSEERDAEHHEKHGSEEERQTEHRDERGLPAFSLALDLVEMARLALDTPDRMHRPPSNSPVAPACVP